MATERVFLRYTIHLTDQALVETLNATEHQGNTGVGAVIMAPYVPGPPESGAAITYPAPPPLQVEPSDPFVPPCVRSEWFATAHNFPTNVNGFRRKTGGWFGIPFLFPREVVYYWRGVFAYTPEEGVTPIPGEVQVPIPRRRYTQGAETESAGSSPISRAGSRHLNGFGYHFDSHSSDVVSSFTDSGAGAQNNGWDRFYLRFRRFDGSGKVRLWRSSGATSAAAGAELGVLPSGHLVITNISSTGVETSIATVDGGIVPLHTWKKIDILYTYGASAALQVWVNGVQRANLVGVFGSGVGLSQSQNVQATRLGSLVANTLVVDYDDWVVANQPTAGSSTSVRASRDWMSGSKIVWIGAEANGSDDSGLFSGFFELMRQRPLPNAPTTRTTTTALARLCILTDADREIDAALGSTGLVAMRVAAYQESNGAADPQLGYRLPGDAPVLATIVSLASPTWAEVFYQPTGLGFFEGEKGFAGTELIFDKANDGVTGGCHVLGAECELIGTFGPEDVVPLSDDAQETLGGDAGSEDLVAAVKDDCVQRGIDLTGPCGAFEIVKRVAWRLRASGAGLLDKPTGNNCDGYATDIVCYPSGILYDCLIDGGGANEPNWEPLALPADPTRYRPPFNPGDDPTETLDTVFDPQSIPPPMGIHNAPYPQSPWARFGPPPISPVIIHAGQYTGNNTRQDLFFRAPVHFLYVRPLSGGTGGWFWLSSLNSSHAGLEEQHSNAGSHVLIDPNFAGAAAEDDQEQRTVVRIAGTNANINASAVVYQYLAFCDPGMRFSEAGALEAAKGSVDYVTSLLNEAFLPEFGFLFREPGAGSGSTTVGLFVKGIGHTAGQISRVNAAQIADGLSWANGTLTSKSAFHAAQASTAFMVFRRSDGELDPGEPGVMQLATYTGDGTASRTISLAPLSGRRPMWAIVVPHNAASVMRDPAHTGTNSLTLPSANNASTGITGGGIDSISVGSALNSNGQVYDVLVFPSCDATAGNGGWGVSCENVPVEPIPPCCGPWGPLPPEPTPPITPTTPGGGGGTDFEGDCVEASQFIINQSLSRIGIAKQVADIVEEQSVEASTARLHYGDDVSATLRDHPWAFATRYADLVWVAGTEAAPVNGDWTYAYRAPESMAFARRIVRDGGLKRAWDLDPIEFRVGSDDTAALIYCNERVIDPLDPTNETLYTVSLEYTLRLGCSAAVGDALFRQALIWRHAHSLAPILSRDEKKVALCWQMYLGALEAAKVKNVSEEQKDPTGDPDWLQGRN